MLSKPDVEEPHPFGGVGRDLRWVASVKIPYNLMYIADLPLSLIGDVWTLPRTFRRKPEGSDPTKSLDRSQNLSDSPE
jgi:hypothetical protein